MRRQPKSPKTKIKIAIKIVKMVLLTPTSPSGRGRMARRDQEKRRRNFVVSAKITGTASEITLCTTRRSVNFKSRRAKKTRNCLPC